MSFHEFAGAVQLDGCWVLPTGLLFDEWVAVDPPSGLRNAIIIFAPPLPSNAIHSNTAGDILTDVSENEIEGQLVNVKPVINQKTGYGNVEITTGCKWDWNWWSYLFFLFYLKVSYVKSDWKTLKYFLFPSLCHICVKPILSVHVFFLPVHTCRCAYELLCTGRSTHDACCALSSRNAILLENEVVSGIEEAAQGCLASDAARARIPRTA